MAKEMKHHHGNGITMTQLEDADDRIIVVEVEQRHGPGQAPTAISVIHRATGIKVTADRYDDIYKNRNLANQILDRELAERRFVVGRYVRAAKAMPEVPIGTKGLIIQDFETGFMVAWDLPERPIPEGKSPEDIAGMWAINPDCPLRDGFDKEHDVYLLEIVP